MGDQPLQITGQLAWHAENLARQPGEGAQDLGLAAHHEKAGGDEAHGGFGALKNILQVGQILAGLGLYIRHGGTLRGKIRESVARGQVAVIRYPTDTGAAGPATVLIARCGLMY